MKPFYVLLISFVIAIFAIRMIIHHYDYAMAARIAMSVMLLFTAIGHFAFPRGMMMMIPELVPGRLILVYTTGIIEIIAAVGLQIESLKSLTGILLITFFLIVLPANIYAAAKNIDYQTGKNNGNGLNYLWFRVPLQVFFIIWTWMSTL